MKFAVDSYGCSTNKSGVTGSSEIRETLDLPHLYPGLQVVLPFCQLLGNLQGAQLGNHYLAI